MARVTSQLVPLERNFLVPNGTFFVELGAFALLFFLLAKYVIPPINKAMTPARTRSGRSSPSTGGQGQATKAERSSRPDRRCPQGGHADP